MTYHLGGRLLEVPGAPVFVGRATRYRSKHLALGHDIDLSGLNALQSAFVFDG